MGTVCHPFLSVLNVDALFCTLGRCAIQSVCLAVLLMPGCREHDIC